MNNSSNFESLLKNMIGKAVVKFVTNSDRLFSCKIFERSRCGRLLPKYKHVSTSISRRQRPGNVIVAFCTMAKPGT
jgi:hypothetical protein